jgi:signal transduction histidine kinase
VEDICSRVVAHAWRLIPSHSAVVALFDVREASYRVIAGSGGGLAHELREVEWGAPLSARFAAAFAPAEVRECPGGPLDDLILPFLQASGVGRVLYAAVGPHPMPAAFIAWARRSEKPFTRIQRLAAQGIADQTFTALAAARLYESATGANRLKSEFVSTMSHELRTPLNVIMGYNQILTELLPPAPETTRALDAVHRAGVELLDLIEATLDLGRLESGRETVTVETVSVRELFDELAREFAPVPRASGVALLWEAGDVPALIVDRRKLKTALKNLVGNALKFTPAGSVRVECRRAGENYRFRIIDTGIGIRAEHHAAVFEMFRQVDSSDTRRYGGTGLGLYIVRQLVGLLGGQVTLESSPGSGSVFTVTVPGRPDARAQLTAA